MDLRHPAKRGEHQGDRPFRNSSFDRATVARIDHLLNIAEYKRRQAAPGVKVTSRNFGRDRRYPITNRFRDSGKPLAAPDETLISRAGRASVEAFEG